MSKEKRKPINDEIKANKVQLITDAWENLWEMSLAKAKQIAEGLEQIASDQDKKAIEKKPKAKKRIKEK